MRDVSCILKESSSQKIRTILSESHEKTSPFIPKNERCTIIKNKKKSGIPSPELFQMFQETVPPWENHSVGSGFLEFPVFGNSSPSSRFVLFSVQKFYENSKHCSPSCRAIFKTHTSAKEELERKMFKKEQTVSLQSTTMKLRACEDVVNGLL